MSAENKEPASPCIRVCLLDEAGYCLGCRRSLEEIAGWQDFSNAEKRAVLAQLGERPLAPEEDD